MRRRRTDAFSLSFLDCICCGFGAVIMFYVMMSARTGLRLVHRSDQLQAEINALEIEVREGRANLTVLRNSLDKTQTDSASAAASIASASTELQSRREQLASYDADAVAQRAQVEQLKSDVAALQEGQRRLEAGSLEHAVPGQELRVQGGSGERRYITGIVLHGRRILILVDCSASMLHEDLVSILRLRNADDATKRRAAKWRRTAAIVTWMATQLPAGGQYQIFGFNTKAAPLSGDSTAGWLDVSDAPALARNLEALYRTVPRDGTSLINAFAAVKRLNPLPDQIVLITDGLPTQGVSAGAARYIDSGQRERLFDEAVAAVPAKVPVDVVLMPMRGDIEAAHHFWKLARTTKGTLLFPSKDWP